MESTSFSSSIQRTSVYTNPSLEFSLGGISYFNTLLVDLINSIVIETINYAKQQNKQQQSYLSPDAITAAINAVFSYDLAEYILDQSQGRIQHSSMKNLPKYNPETEPKDDVLSDQEEDDDDVRDFEIIPRESTMSTQHMSLFFPTELVYSVVQDMIKRKKVIYSGTDFYERIEMQSRESFIYTYLSYCLEVVSTRILKRLDQQGRDQITEDHIRKTIASDAPLKDIRQKAVHITNVTNHMLQGHSIDSIPSSSSMSSSFSISEIQTSAVSSTIKSQSSPVLAPMTTTSTTTDIATVLEKEQPTIVPPQVEEVKVQTAGSDEPLLEESAQVTSSSSDNSSDNYSNSSNNNNNNVDSDLPATSTPAAEVIAPEFRLCTKIPSLIFLDKPLDLIKVLREDRIFLEASNGAFLVMLILLGLAIQSINMPVKC
ncbi:hypothetical protein SAMD00019534_108130 [Acytostelium subglobosum LB1]|uniref:hypothetical protein n=1 Tax=Acytostelium subglobosum LB1 TaxID=1410327 RepID=UPI0006449A5A|nr:hypothetical protein SAMD00019534_108130 [Acytostelium subglobosum LB1]GAM27637.1 hypothetical protein SAMD00019534_108130 [Acytostelium subglobosum LB1]|eukprot:XP_012749296.1 hypothetical protein SAMD00019534_108130 [Acytostelium subglobosum LB1]